MRRAATAAAVFVASSAAVLAAGSADDLIRRANAAVLAGDPAAADPLYADAAERTTDPGLVAFNTAAVRFAQGRFYEAEVLYARTLDDRACPPARAARAWFNRGVCLLRRGGDAAAYRSAVACFERCLDSPAADPPLAADARHNLELAKLLWAEAARKSARPENPNTPAPEDMPEPPPPQRGGDEQEPTPDPNGKDGSPTPSDAKQTKQSGPQATKDFGTKTDDRATQGANPKLQPLPDDDKARPLSIDETRAYLRQTEDRLRRERQLLLRSIAGPDRPGVKDW
jgi:tetratricopeptide (TPR) repeat protein